MKSELMLNLKRHECNTLNSNVFYFSPTAIYI